MTKDYQMHKRFFNPNTHEKSGNKKTAQREQSKNFITY